MSVSSKRGKLHLGLFGRFLEALERHLVFRKIDALLLLEFGDDPVHDALVDVVAAEVGIAVGGFHFDDAVAYFEDGDVEGAAAEIVHGDGFVGLLIETVGQRGRGRLIDDALDVQTGDFARVFGGLALGVVEVGGNRDDGFGDLLAEVGFGRFLQLGENHRRNLRRRLLLAVDIDARVVVIAPHDLVRDHLHFFADFAVVTAHEPLDREDGLLGVRDGLALGHLADKPFAGFGESYH